MYIKHVKKIAAETNKYITDNLFLNEGTNKINQIM